MRGPPSGEVIDAMRGARAAGQLLPDIALRFNVSLTAAAKHTRGFAPVREDTVDLKVRRRCKDALPVLPALVDGQVAGVRAMAVLAFTLRTAQAPEGN